MFVRELLSMHNPPSRQSPFCLAINQSHYDAQETQTIKESARSQKLPRGRHKLNRNERSDLKLHDWEGQRRIITQRGDEG
jgi:hypothetical protein